MSDSVKLYVSGASSELARVESAIGRIRAEGFEVTYDWTTDVEAALARETALTQREREDMVNAALAGIDAADIVLWLASDEPSWGAPFEIGYAAGRGKIVVAIGLRKRSLFGARCIELDLPDDEALAILFTSTFGAPPRKES